MFNVVKCVGRCCSKWKDLKCCGSLAFSFVSILFSSTSKRIYNRGPLFGIFLYFVFVCLRLRLFSYFVLGWKESMITSLNIIGKQSFHRIYFWSEHFLVVIFLPYVGFWRCIIIFPRCICFWLNLRLPFNAIILPVYICIWLNLSLTHFAFWRCNNIGCLTVFGKFYFVPLQRE